LLGEDFRGFHLIPRIRFEHDDAVIQLRDEIELIANSRGASHIGRIDHDLRGSVATFVRVFS
jgi:hypothetical protein